MKKLQFLNSFLIIGILFAVSSCETVYIPDPIDPRLPKYTEDGNAVGGALVNDSLWRSEYFKLLFYKRREPFLRYKTTTDSLSIEFHGTIGESYRTISFGLKGYGIKSLQQMTKLNTRIINFDGVNNVATIYRIVVEPCPTTAKGQIFFRSVKFDPENNSLTLSGTFGFNYDDPLCGKIAVNYGRFDYIVHNFYQ